MEATALGRHGGGTLRGKLLSYAERVRALTHHFDRARPDVVVTLSGTEAPRAAFGLGIPVVCFADLPESDAVSRLSLPATRVLAPWIVRRQDLTRYGVASASTAADPSWWVANRSGSQPIPGSTSSGR